MNQNPCRCDPQQTSLSFTDYGQRRPARRSSRYTNNKPQQTTSSSLDSAHGTNEEDTNTSSFSTNTMSDKKRESWQINTDWDYNYDNSFTSQASLYHVLGKAFCVRVDVLICVGKRFGEIVGIL